MSPAPANQTRSVAWCLVGLVLFLGAAVFALFFYGPDYNLAFLLPTSAALLVLIVLAGPGAFAHALQEAPGTTLMALYALLALLLHHAWVSQSPETSIAGSWMLALGPLAFLALRLVALAAGERSTVFFGSAVGLVLVIVMVSAGRWWLYGARPYEPLTDASTLSILLYLAFVPAAHHILRSVTRLRGRLHALALALLAFVCLAVIFATASRAAIGLLAFASLAWAVLSLRRSIDPARLIVLLGIALAAYGLAYLGSPSLKVSVNESVLADPAADQRLTLLAAAWAAYRDSGVHGSGALTFVLSYARLRPVTDQTSGGAYVHNDYLQLLAEGGPWLLMPLLALAVTAGLQVLLGLFAPAHRLRFGRLGGWLALALVCLHALVNFVVYTPALAIALGVLLAWTLTLAAGLPAERARVRQTSSLATLRRWSLLGWVGVIAAGALALGVLLIDATNLAVFSQQPAVLGSERYLKSPERQLAYARTSSRILPQRGLPKLALALAAEQRARQALERSDQAALVAGINLASERFRAAREADPWNTSGLLSFARFLAFRQSPAVRDRLPIAPLPSGLDRLATGESPQALLEDALARNPRALAVLGALVGLLDQAGRPGEALERIERHFVRWEPNHRVRQPRLARRWLEEYARRAERAGRQPAAAAARQRLEEWPATPPPPPRLWLKRWRASAGS
ncbi:MAG: O-antigen ligase family protein [Pseudomonadota bacterium]